MVQRVGELTEPHGKNVNVRDCLLHVQGSQARDSRERAHPPGCLRQTLQSASCFNEVRKAASQEHVNGKLPGNPWGAGVSPGLWDVIHTTGNTGSTRKGFVNKGKKKTTSTFQHTSFPHRNREMLVHQSKQSRETRSCNALATSTGVAVTLGCYIHI